MNLLKQISSFFTGQKSSLNEEQKKFFNDKIEEILIEKENTEDSITALVYLFQLEEEINKVLGILSYDKTGSARANRTPKDESVSFETVFIVNTFNPSKPAKSAAEVIKKKNIFEKMIYKDMSISFWQIKNYQAERDFLDLLECIEKKLISGFVLLYDPKACLGIFLL
ncbi:MAG TPA: hypothetical protein PKC14_02565 [Candidatus Absconditabacterales bacterium]|nr:hypothetical protein [Candidatus Absconditabacterales bacterium]